MDEETTSSVITLMVTGFVLSMAAIAYLFQKHVAGQSLLAYQPRRRVPWGPLAALVAMTMPILGVATFFVDSEQTTAAEVSTESLLITGWSNFTFMVLFVAGGLAWLVTFFRADVHDLGLPTSWKQLTHDVGLGIFAAIAALLPIYAVQLTLISALQSETQHPLVKQLEEHQTPAMLLLGFAMAVIAAPLFEEFTFRGLLQGWLERREDEILGFVSTERQPTIELVATGAAKDDVETGGAEQAGNGFDLYGAYAEGSDEVDDIPAQDDHAAASPTLDVPAATIPATGIPATGIPAVGIPAVRMHPIGALSRPSHGWIPDLPHGWTPILISGVAFGLAHIGHGVAPVSLVLFGIVLGYLYQRTHRLVPSITAHMLFNSYSMVMLWLQLEAPTG